MKINSYAALEPKADLRQFEYEPSKLGPFDVEIKISHCGICHSDIHLIDNDWMISSYPLVPGHEVVGHISALGENVKKLDIGQRVGIGWQSGACLNCEYCNTGQENLCKESVATCVGRFGGFADIIRTDSRFVYPIPDELSSEIAAPLLCGGITVYSPLKIFNVRPNHKVGVIGIGGLGHLAIQFAAAMGCEVTAFSSTQDKQKEAESFGAKKFVVSNNSNEIAKAAGTLDFIISTVTVPLNWNEYLNCLKPNGRLNFVGATFGPLDISVGSLVMGQKSVSGSVIGGRAMIAEMLELAERNEIKTAVEVFPMNKVNSALKKVRENKARYRIVLKN